MNKWAFAALTLLLAATATSADAQPGIADIKNCRASLHPKSLASEATTLARREESLQDSQLSSSRPGLPNQTTRPF